MSDYWLGVLTIPALALALYTGFFAWITAIQWLDHRGFNFDLKLRRRIDRISDFRLRHDIWWERSFGPVFVGGWYRESHIIRGSRRRLINRWIGIGSPHGPCFMAYRKRDLGAVLETTEEA